ncbi:unnamed protein product, partial [Musa hybrid cultivar]
IKLLFLDVGQLEGAIFHLLMLHSQMGFQVPILLQPYSGAIFHLQMGFQVPILLQPYS